MFSCLLENCWYSFIPHQNLWNNGYLKISCKVETKTKLINCSCSVTLKSHKTTIHCENIFYPCMILWRYALVMWKALVHWTIKILQMFTHFILYYQIVTFINITSSLIRNVLKYREAVKLIGVYLGFSKF